MHPFLGAFAPSIQLQASDTTTPTTVTTTTSGTAFNNITPVQLVASTTYDATSLQIRLITQVAVAGAATPTVFEIMAGSAGNEYSIIGPVVAGGYTPHCRWTFPIFIPAGTRLSIRVRSARLSTALSWMYVIGYAPNRDGVGLPTRWVSYGVTDDASANAQGVNVTPGSGVWGSWTAVTTSTTYAHDLWLPMLDCGTQTTVTAFTARTRWAIASTANAATAATNATVWHGPWATTNTSESIFEALSSTSAPFYYGGFGGMCGIFYQPAAAGAAVSVAAQASAVPSANSLGCSILAAL